MTEKQEGLIARLLHKAAASPVEDRELLIEAAETIRTLRLLVNIRDDIVLEDIEPEGSA